MACASRTRSRTTDPMAPRPVHPRAARHHGLFGLPLVRQHMMADERWTPNSLTEEFKGMGDLLARRVVFKRLETEANRKRSLYDNRTLKKQCHNGRAKLQLLLYGDNTKSIRNYLIDRKDMQRLYQKMPVYQVVDNINQRTFVMRKERDRLRFRLEQLKTEYGEGLLERGKIEDRIKYQDEFVLEEEIKSREFMKKIENSNVRLNAIKTINTTYKKMVQVLQQDAIFYEPIMRSLTLDIEDQGNFIKHILYIGMPAIAKFKELSEEYRQHEDKSRKVLQAKLHWVANFKKQRRSIAKADPGRISKHIDPAKRYVRETQSMLFLRNQLDNIEFTIRQVKFATLCSQAKEIYPRIKSQVDNNIKLDKMIQNNILGHHHIDEKMKAAEVLQGVLVHNLSEEELVRLERIKELKEAILAEDQIEADTLAHNKNRADAYVLLRFTIWNLHDILRHVDRTAKVARMLYPVSYLQLPLLKFEMLTMRACPPEIYEEDLQAVMRLIKRKLHKVMKFYNAEKSPTSKNRMKEEKLAEQVDLYHNLFVEGAIDVDLEDVGEVEPGSPEAQPDLLQESKTMQNVPNRKQIKAQSAKLVEDLSKKDD